MIYEIKISDVYIARQNGATFIINSIDNTALVRSQSIIENIVIIAELADDDTPDGKLQLDEILKLAKWRQPCKDCEL